MHPTQAIAVDLDLEGASDAALVAAARQGKAAAFRTIMRHNNRCLFHLIRGVLHDEAEAEDALQDAYVRAFSSLDGFKGDAALSTWLARIALNEALGRLRRRRHMIELDALDTDRLDAGADVIPFPLAQASAGDPEHSAARAEVRRMLERAIDGLPDGFRLVFVLRGVEQMSVEETAACLGVPEATVKTRFHRAKRLLRLALDEQLGSVLGEAFPFAGARCDRIVKTVLDRLGQPDAP